MSSPPNPQHEPTMEEILASIRKIISEDQAETEKGQAAATAPAQPDVLELTQELKDDGSVVPVAMEAVESQAAPMREMSGREMSGFDRMDKMESPKADSMDMHDNEDFISHSARHAVGQAFGALESQEQKREEPPMSAGGNLDAAFERAVSNAFEPAIHRWVDSRSGEIMEQLKPLIRQWMDDNLPAIIENAVRNEIARAVRNRGR